MKSLTFGIFIAFTLSVLFVAISNDAFADVISPNKQMDLNFSAKEVVCKENLIKVIRISNENAVCVKIDTVEDLVNRGIVKSPNPEIISDRMNQESESVGMIVHLATTKPHVDPGEVVTSKKISVFNYVIKVCSDDVRIKAPEVIISSDKETKSIKLSGDVLAKSCNTTATKVKASDPNSITSRLLNHGGVTEIIVELENKIENLKLDLSEQREKISTINKEVPGNDRAKKVSAIHKKITDIRDDLKNVRADMQKYLLFLSLSSSTDLSPIAKEKSVTGIRVDDVSGEIISVHNALIQPENPVDGSKAFNVILEVCTDKNVLRIPVVQISSDVETKTVKMAEKIIANSCQITTVKISAKDVNSILIDLSGQTANSATIVELEKKIISLKDAMSLEQKKLNASSTSSLLSKEERNMTIGESTVKIEELRKEINNAKIELHKILLQVYR